MNVILDLVSVIGVMVLILLTPLAANGVWILIQMVVDSIRRRK